MVGGVLMIRTQNWYIYIIAEMHNNAFLIIVNIFVNTQSILKILASTCNGFSGLCLCKKNITTNFEVMKVNGGHT